RYLTPEQRALAPRIFAALERAREAIEGGRRDFEAIEAEGMSELQAAGFRPDYFVVRDAETLGSPTPDSKNLVVLTAARIGRARLIDNVRVGEGRGAWGLGLGLEEEARSASSCCARRISRAQLYRGGAHSGLRLSPDEEARRNSSCGDWHVALDI